MAKKNGMNQAQKKAFVEAKLAEMRKEGKIKSTPEGRVYESIPGTLLDNIKLIMADGYDHVLFIKMGNAYHIRGCFENEVVNEWHNLCQKAYSTHFGSPFILTNSQDPSGKVLPANRIKLSKATVSSYIEPGLKNFSVRGGQYEEGRIFYKAA